MAATTISRPSLTDDDGSGTTGGILNSTNLGLWLYDKVDALFTASSAWSATSAGLLTLTVENTNTGTAAGAGIHLGNSASAYRSQIIQYSTGFTSAGAAKQDGLLVYTAGTGGLTLKTAGAGAAITLHTPDVDPAVTVTSTGHVVLTELTTNPSTTVLAADAALALYTKADKLAFAYNNGGTLTYLTLALDGTSTTWSHGTTAP